MAFFPQIGSSMILTQLPYSGSQAFQTIVQDAAGGMRWSFPRRANSQLSGYMQAPRGRFSINFSLISDAEVATLLTFFRSVRGRWGTFSLLDPAGNLLQYSEDVTQSYWDKSIGVGYAALGGVDPFGGGDAATIYLTPPNGAIVVLVGPAGGGVNGFRLCLSLWAKSSSPVSLTIGFIDGGSYTKDVQLSASWRRISFARTIASSGAIYATIGSNASWGGANYINVYGMQVCSTPGESAYAKTPGGYGYLPLCRFDVDSFAVKSVGLNQNSLSLPIVEVNS
jgi:hypothetical protein